MISQALMNIVNETLDVCKSTVYAEPQSKLHTDIARDAWSLIKNRTCLMPPAKILDIGCGSGFAMRMFAADGFEVHGMTCCREEIEALGGQYTIYPWDMHELSRLSRMYHFIFARHVIEHSFMPFLMLRGISEALVDNGFAYVEIPLGDTQCNHWNNANHYSLLSPRGWIELARRAGFIVIDECNISFEVVAGPDTYFGMILRKGQRYDPESK